MEILILQRSTEQPQQHLIKGLRHNSEALTPPIVNYVNLTILAFLLEVINFVLENGVKHVPHLLHSATVNTKYEKSHINKSKKKIFTSKRNYYCLSSSVQMLKYKLAFALKKSHFVSLKYQYKCIHILKSNKNILSPDLDISGKRQLNSLLLRFLPHN